MKKYNVFRVEIDGYTIYGDEVNDLLILLKEKLEIMSVGDVEEIHVGLLEMSEHEYKELNDFEGF